MKKLNKKFYLWWVSVLLIATAVFWATYTGITTLVWETDVTMITSVISVVFVVMNMVLGYVAHLSDSKSNPALSAFLTDKIWFMSEFLMGLGILGTVLGLIHMVTGMASLQDSSQIVSMLDGMRTALGYALSTNALGLAASMILKFQASFILDGPSDETV